MIKYHFQIIFISNIMLFLLVSSLTANHNVSQPNKYAFNGSMHLLLTDSKVDIQYKYNNNQSIRLTYLTNNSEFIYHKGKLSRVFIMENKSNRGCYDLDLNDWFQTMNLLPDLSKFELKLETKLIKGILCAVFTYSDFRGDLVENATFTQKVSNYYNFYCQMMTDFQQRQLCRPIRFEQRGHDDLRQAHAALYIYDYDEFDVLPEFNDSDFEFDKMCYQKAPDVGYIDIAKIVAKALKNGDLKIFNNVSTNLPSSFDLRLQGIIPRVKDQGKCMNCYAYGVSGVLEGRINMLNQYYHLPQVAVSVQQLVSCNWPVPGCNTGDSFSSFYVMKKKFNGNIPLHFDFPYFGVETECESTKWNRTGYHIKQLFMVEPGNVQSMKTALLDGPIMAYMYYLPTFSYYSGGVYNDPACGHKFNVSTLDHIVTIVGWDIDQELGEHWIVQNSFGNLWGSEGYANINMNMDCGLSFVPLFVSLGRQYHAKLTFEVPLANISQQLDVYYDEIDNRSKVVYDDGLRIDYVNVNNTDFKIVTQFDLNNTLSQQECYKQSSRNELFDVIPDLSIYELLPDTIILGKKAKHFRQLTVSEKTEQADYYCVSNDAFCQPLRWEIHGRHPISKSHYDYYVFDYHNFENVFQFEKDDFSLPPKFTSSSCNDNDSYESANVIIKQLNFIENHNNNAKYSFKMTSNKFTGLLYQKFLKTYANERKTYSNSYDYEFKHKVPFYAPIHSDVDFINSKGQTEAFPDFVDWRIISSTGIQDQCDCGSCWAFGAIGTLEMRINAHFVNESKKPLVKLSEQALIDCIWSNNIAGCDGGSVAEAYDRIIDSFLGHVPSSKDYPYIGLSDECKVNLWQDSFFKFSTFSMINRLDVGALKYALLSGPVSVSIIVPESMIFYSSGIYYDEVCSNGKITDENLQHAVVLVGYGTDPVEGLYWIIKNSWGNIWGQDGYILIKQGYCGVTFKMNVPNVSFNEKSDF